MNLLKQLPIIFSVTTLLTFISCKEDALEKEISNINPRMQVLMEPSPFFKAKDMVTSENGQYIVATLDTRFDGRVRNYEYYYSTDAGSNFQLITGIEGYSSVSNNGKLLIGTQLRDLNDLSTVSIPVTSSNNRIVLSENGTVYFTKQNQNNEWTLYKFENGNESSTGVSGFSLSVDAMYSNGQIGFFNYYYNILAVYDIASNELTERTFPSFETQRMSGAYSFGNYHKFTFNNGNFAIGSTQAAVVVDANNQLTYYDYQDEYKSGDNPWNMLLDNSTLYLHLGTDLYTIQNQIFTLFKTENNSLQDSNKQWPLTKSGDDFYYSGFIEGGSHSDYGLIHESSTDKEYLNTSVTSADLELTSGFVVKAGEKLYFKNKVYNTDTKTYSNSEFDNVIYGFAESNRILLYASNGTFLSTDNGNSWQLQGEDLVKPNFVVKNNQGGYYAMTDTTYKANVGGTGFALTTFDLATYSSTNAIHWELLATYTGITGTPPGGISSDGKMVYSYNSNPFGNPQIEHQVSEDGGVSFTELESDDERKSSTMPGLQASYHETSSGRHIAFVTLSGSLETFSCTEFYGSCVESNFSNEDIIYTEFRPFYTLDNKAIVPGVTVFELSGL